MKEEDSIIKGDGHANKYIGIDIPKLIFGILFLGLFTYVIHTFIIFPLGIIYGVSITTPYIITSILFILGSILIISKSRKSSEERNTKIDFGLN